MDLNSFAGASRGFMLPIWAWQREALYRGGEHTSKRNAGGKPQSTIRLPTRRITHPGWLG
jgi:hypothetical protein